MEPEELRRVARAFVDQALRWLDRTDVFNPDTVVRLRKRAQSDEPERFVVHLGQLLGATRSRGIILDEEGAELWRAADMVRAELRE